MKTLALALLAAPAFAAAPIRLPATGPVMSAPRASLGAPAAVSALAAPALQAPAPAAPLAAAAAPAGPAAPAAEGTARFVPLPSWDPLLVRAQAMAQRWLDNNVMNDGGALIDAAMIVVYGDKRAAMAPAARRAILEYVKEKPEYVLSGEPVVGRASINKLAPVARTIAVEGFDADPDLYRNIKPIRRDIGRLLARLGHRSHVQGWMAKAAAASEEGLVDLYHYVFRNARNGKAVSFFVRSAHPRDFQQPAQAAPAASPAARAEMKVSRETREKVLRHALAVAWGRDSKVQWGPALPAGGRFVQVDLRTKDLWALLPVGAFAPGAPASDPNAAEFFILAHRRADGRTEYSQSIRFMAETRPDGVPTVTEATARKILPFARALADGGFRNPGWSQTLPSGTRWISTRLYGIDDFSFFLPAGAMAPGAPVQDPNAAEYFIAVQELGGDRSRVRFSRPIYFRELQGALLPAEHQKLLDMLEAQRIQVLPAPLVLENLKATIAADAQLGRRLTPEWQAALARRLMDADNMRTPVSILISRVLSESGA